MADKIRKMLLSYVEMCPPAFDFPAKPYSKSQSNSERRMCQELLDLERSSSARSRGRAFRIGRRRTAAKRSSFGRIILMYDDSLSGYEAD